jgi:hypothetical protein
MTQELDQFAIQSDPLTVHAIPFDREPHEKKQTWMEERKLAIPFRQNAA